MTKKQMPNNKQISNYKYEASKRAETVLEVLIAVFILSFMVIQAGQLQISSIRHETMNEYLLIADGLATEGVEMMRNVVASNRLRYSANVDACWDTLPAPNSVSDAAIDINNCDQPQNTIAGGGAGVANYYLRRDPETLQFSIEPAFRPIRFFVNQYLTTDFSRNNCSNNFGEDYRVLQYDDPAGLPGFCIRGAPVGAPNYNSLYYSAARNSPEYNRGIQTPFFRGITVEPVVPFAGAPRSALRVTSTVNFIYLGKVHEVKASTVVHRKALR